MSWKERIENNISLFVLGLLGAGFTAGFTFHKVLVDVAGPTSPKSAEVCPLQLPWTDSARKAEWLPKNECPAYPVTISVTSPGDGSSIEISSSSPDPYAYVDVVIQTSRPLPPTTSIGLVVNQEGSLNFYVVFPYFKVDESRKVFRDEQYLRLPFQPDVDSILNLWAVLVDDKRKFGSVYSNLDQIRASGSEVSLSPKTAVKLRQRR